MEGLDVDAEFLFQEESEFFVAAGDGEESEGGDEEADESKDQ